MATHHYERSLNLADITLYTISAVLLIDQLAISVTLGIGSLFWWMVLLLVYLLPSVLVISELGSSFPEQGGIYAWIRSAFGPRWAVRTTWLYWINTALWIPSTFILLTGMFAALFFPEMTIWMRVAMAIGLVWALVWFNIIRLGLGKWLLNLNTYMKFIIFGVLGIGGLLYINAHGSVNELSLETLTPSFDDGLFAIPVIIYGLMGFELVSASSEELKSPEKNIFRATLLSGAIIAGLYFVCVFAVMGVLPAAEIDLGSGLLSTFEKLLGGSTAAHAIALILVCFAMYTLFSSLLAWAIAVNRSAAAAAEEGELPAVFGVFHTRNETPMGASILLGVLSTLILIIYAALATSAEDLFWSLFSAGAVIFLMPYIGMYLAFVGLRARYPERERPFRIPGPEWVGNLVAISCAALVGLSVVLLIWSPVDGFKLPVIAGFAVAVMIGEVIVATAERRVRR